MKKFKTLVSVLTVSASLLAASAQARPMTCDSNVGKSSAIMSLIKTSYNSISDEQNLYLATYALASGLVKFQGLTAESYDKNLEQYTCTGQLAFYQSKGDTKKAFQNYNMKFVTNPKGEAKIVLPQVADPKASKSYILLINDLSRYIVESSQETVKSDPKKFESILEPALKIVIKESQALLGK